MIVAGKQQDITYEPYAVVSFQKATVAKLLLVLSFVPDSFSIGLTGLQLTVGDRDFRLPSFPWKAYNVHTE